MKKSPLIPVVSLCLAALLAAACPAFAQDKAPQPDVSFFTKVRMDYAKRPDFNPIWKMDEERQAVISAYKAKDYAKVADLARTWLDKCPVDGEVHYMRSQAMMQTGDITHYAAELYYFYGLIQSVASSGDGQSDKTAFKVISAEEEYSLLGDFGAEPIGQSLQGTCDVMRCKLQDGREVTYYFDTSIALAAEAKQYNPQKK
jgi:hypothetical protein